MCFEKGNDHERKVSRNNSITLYRIKAKEKVKQEIDRRRKRLIKKTQNNLKRAKIDIQTQAYQ